VSAWSEAFKYYRPYETGCVYTLINNTEYQITKAGSASGKVIIEDVYRGKPVTSIADNAFKGNFQITEVVLGKNIKSIGNNAFYKCEYLTKIDIPESVSSIGERAFQRCISLEEVVLPEAVTMINDSTFTLCKALKKLTFGSNVQYIGKTAFSDCVSLTEVTIPDSVQMIDEDAFSGNTSLTSVNIGKGVQSIGNNAFQMCKSLKNIKFAEDSRLVYIGQRAFYQNEVLESIAFPSTVIQLDAECFYQCAKLAQIDLPDSLQKLGGQAFHGTALYRNQVEAGEKLIYIDKWVISADTSLYTTVEAIATVPLDGYETQLIKGDTVGVASNVFAQFQKLIVVKMPATMKYLGEFSFALCPELLRVDLTDAVLIDNYAFYGCEILTTFFPGDKLVEIGDYAFFGCTRLNSFTPPEKTLKVIGTYAFKNTGLWKKAEETDSGLVYVGNWLVGAAKKDIFAVSLNKGTVGIADYAFYDCMFLNSANLTGVKYLGRAAFYGCMALSAVQFDDNLTEIKEYTFYSCARLSYITNGFPRSLTYIGRSAFYGCISLLNVDMGRASVKSIDQYAFYECSSLETVNLGQKLETINDFAFYKCEQLSELILPDTMKTIGSRAFYKNTALTSVSFGEGLVSIGSYAFSVCEALTEVKLPDSLQYVSNNAFYKCTALKSVDLGQGVVWLGSYAFYGIDGVDSLQLPASLVQIDSYAFKGWNGLNSIVLRKDIQYIGAHVFYGCKGMTIYTDGTAEEITWNSKFNSSYRPIIYGCTLSEDKTYVVSVAVKEDTILNKMSKGDITAPEREGYTFAGWATQANGAVVYTAADIVKVPIGTTLYAVWEVAEEVPETEMETGTENA
ncbi:MAG: leucine-rich repeat protein, partial [Clostridia bacterium]|nr:leucine-rich repeat protein [Clostridia bacterium]